MMDAQPQKTPITDLLAKIPQDLVIQWQDKEGLRAWHNCPIGRLAQEAIAALSAKPEPECSIPFEPTKAMIEAGAQRLVNCGEGNAKWPDDYRPIDVLNARIEAERVWRSMWLECKPEPKCKTCDDTRVVSAGSYTVDCTCKAYGHTDCLLCKGAGTYAATAIDDCPDCAWHEPDALVAPAERVDEWLESPRAVTYYVRGAACITVDSVREYLAALHSQHQAEIELLRSKLALVLRENRRLSDELKKVDAGIKSARAAQEST